MPPIRVKFKHAGKVYDDENLVCDTDQPPIEFKKAVRDRTGVPLERMKVMGKGGMLKVSIRRVSDARVVNSTLWRIMLGRLQLGQGSAKTRRGKPGAFDSFSSKLINGLFRGTHSPSSEQPVNFQKLQKSPLSFWKVSSNASSVDADLYAYRHE